MKYSGYTYPSQHCSYCVRTLFEYDTGYTEYGCTLGDANPDEQWCMEDACPLVAKWEVVEEDR